MKWMLKALNPLIWLFNYINYQAHLEGNRGIYGADREPYDFDSDIKYL